MIIPSYTKFKHPDLLKEYHGLLPRAQIISEDMAKFCHDHGQEYLITDILSDETEDVALGRISNSHREGRAWDLRVRNWPLDFRKKFEEHFERKYSKWAAISKETGKPNLIYIHDNGNGIHTHCSIRPYKE